VNRTTAASLGMHNLSRGFVTQPPLNLKASLPERIKIAYYAITITKSEDLESHVLLASVVSFMNILLSKQKIPNMVPNYTHFWVK
jgi:hypothetical protein